MYERYFGFHQKPFSVPPNPDFFFPSSIHREGLANFRYGIRERSGFIVLTGEVGTGKTLLIRSLLRELAEDVKRAVILNPFLTPDELITAILKDLDAPFDEEAGMGAKFEAFNEFLLRENEKGSRVVVIIDEAQNLSSEALEKLRLVSNLETHTSKLLQIILVGQPELKELLSKPGLRQLNQRVTLRHHLKPFVAKETPEYIQHRLEIATGGPPQVTFSKQAIRLIHRASGGIPRIIGVICDYALLVAFTEEARIITAKMANEAIAKYRGNEVVPASPRGLGFPELIGKSLVSGGLIAIGLLAVILAWAGGGLPGTDWFDFTLSEKSDRISKPAPSFRYDRKPPSKSESSSAPQAPLPLPPETAVHAEVPASASDSAPPTPPPVELINLDEPQIEEERDVDASPVSSEEKTGARKADAEIQQLEAMKPEPEPTLAPDPTPTRTASVEIKAATRPAPIPPKPVEVDFHATLGTPTRIPPSASQEVRYGVQVASFQTLDRAERMAMKLRRYGPVFLVPWWSENDEEWIRVIVGIYKDERLAVDMVRFFTELRVTNDAKVVENRWWKGESPSLVPPMEKDREINLDYENDGDENE